MTAKKTLMNDEHEQMFRGGGGELTWRTRWVLPSLDGAMALSSHSRFVEVRDVKEWIDRLSELGNLSSKSRRFCGL